MYTYAQNFEDVMLNRLFHEQATGSMSMSAPGTPTCTP
jgi:hypothetical protein